MTDEARIAVNTGIADLSRSRLTRVLQALGIAASSWYHQPVPRDRHQRRGPKAKPVPPAIESAVVAMATANPWYGYKRIAIMCRRAGPQVTNRQCYQTLKLYELLPDGPNDLWQMDVTYIHIPGFGWWYAVTVIDYYSRYLLAAYLTPSYSALAAVEALVIARREAERIHGPLKRMPFLVTDNGSTFIAKRFMRFTRDRYQQVRIAYRTPTQLGLLERFHRTLKEEEVYWRIYENPADARACLAEFETRYNERRPHWALVPEGGGDPVTPQEVYEGKVRPQLPRWQGWAREAKAKLDALREWPAA
jgi:transposase InsO family protein